MSYVHLQAPFEIIHERMKQRSGHFMPESLLRSQFEALEDPAGEAGVHTVSIEQPITMAVSQAIELLGLSPES